MNVVDLDPRTRTLVRGWTAAAVTCAGSAGSLGVAAGGATLWLRIALAVLSVAGIVAAARFRLPIHHGVVVGLLGVALVPVDARFDRTVIAGLGAVLMVCAAEAIHVARRLVTAAPASASRLDRRWIFTVGAWGLGGVGITAAAAQVDRLGSRWWSAAAAAMIAAAVLGSLAARPNRRERVTGRRAARDAAR